MPTPRQKISALKKKLLRDIKSNPLKYKSSIIREIDLLWRQYNLTGAGSIEQFSEVFLRNFQLDEKQKAILLKEADATRRQIAAIWDDVFVGVIEKQPGGLAANSFDVNYNRMIALTQVDFPQLNDDTRRLVVREIKRAVAGEYSYDSMRHILLNKGLGFSEATTLVNTSVAQFDNMYHIEGSLQAGAKYFLYDGVLQENSRIFCIERIEGVYTVEELKAMDNKQGLPVIPSLGGYNCTHWLTALFGYLRKRMGEKYNKSHHKFGVAA